MVNRFSNIEQDKFQLSDKLQGFTNSKLLDKWSELKKDYSLSLSHFNNTGQGEGDFFKFCYARKDLYYLRLICETRGDYEGYVTVTLDDDVRSEEFINSNSFEQNKNKKQKGLPKILKRDLLPLILSNFGNYMANDKMLNVNKYSAFVENKIKLVHLLKELKDIPEMSEQYDTTKSQLDFVDYNIKILQNQIGSGS